MKKYLLYIFVLISFIIFSKLFINSIIETKKLAFLNAKKHTVTVSYNTIVDLHKNQSDIIFENIINTPKIMNILKDMNNPNQEIKDKARNNLLESLETTYKNLKSKNVRQVHFHTKDNISFLRMHKPEFFGDDLSKARESVVYVNKNKKFFYGFEEGKIFNAYRFVYPLYYENEHIGSVELSVSMKSIIKEFTEHLKYTDVNLILNKELISKKLVDVNNSVYKESKFLQDFLYEEELGFKNQALISNLIFQNVDKLEVKQKLQEGNSFSYINEFNSKYYVSYFQPLKNKITNQTPAYLIFLRKDTEIKKYIDLMNLMFMVFVIIASVVCYYMIKLKNSNNELERNRLIINELNEELNKKNSIQNKMLIHQSRLAQMGEMFSMIVHQLKQPLNTFSLNIDMLAYMYENDPNNKKDIEELKENSRKAVIYSAETIDNFRNFYKTEKEKDEYKLSEIIADSLVILEQKRKFSIVTIDKNLDEELVVFTYGNQLKQVITAIISNAIDALNMQEDKHILISTFKENDEMIIQISDNGPGIPKEIQENIFEAYFSTKNEEDGTGLGLYMAKMITEDTLKGKLSFTTSSKGTSFKIAFK